MHLGIKSKLVLSFLLSNALLASLMFTVSSWRFDQGFQTYVTNVEVQRVQGLVSALAEHYAEQLSWEPIQQDRRIWNAMARAYVDDSVAPMPESPLSLTREPFSERPPPPRNGVPPRLGLGLAQGQGNAQSAVFFDNKILLTDAEKSVLIGPPDEPSENTEWIAIQNNAVTVGYLGLVPRDILNASLDRLFVEEQKTTYAWIAAGSLIIALVIGLILASLWLRPIRLLQAGMQKLSAGDYAQRLDSNGSDELSQLSAQFNLLALTLDKNQSVQEQWIADISHELRTPVAVLRGEIEALVDGVRPLDSQRIASLYEEVLQLQALIAELHELSLSDMGALNYQKSPIDFQEFMRKLMAQFSNACDEAKLALHFNEDSVAVTLNADERKLKQMFVNLFQNTLSYTDQPGSLSVSWELQGKTLVIHWADSAPGVNEEEQGKLFERLFRAENSRNRRTGGSGLGLAIVKNIVESHGGRIAVASSSFGGLMFTIQLPIS